MSDDKRLCPMCKKHMAIILNRKAKTIIKNEEVEFNETVYFCSTLGEDDEDAYFIPPKVMNENLLNAKNAYRKMKAESITPKPMNVSRRNGNYGKDSQ